VPILTARAGVSEILPLASWRVGMLIEMRRSQPQGAIVVAHWRFPAFLFASIAVILPLFAVSPSMAARAFSACRSLSRCRAQPVVVLSALSLIGAMGSYIPPVAFTPVVTAG